MAELVPAHVVTVSDRCSAGEREDASGPAAAAVLSGAGCSVSGAVVGDGGAPGAGARGAGAGGGGRGVLTSGGTGLGPRDLTPEGTLSVLDRAAPGIAEFLRQASGKPHAYLSRGVAGTIGSTLVVNLPGSPRAVTEAVGALLPLLPHILDQLEGGDH